MEIPDREKRTREMVALLATHVTDEEVREMYDLVDHGESGVAFEMLCTQLYEHEWVVTEERLEDLRALGESFGLHPRALSLWEVELREAREAGPDRP